MIRLSAMAAAALVAGAAVLAGGVLVSSGGTATPSPPDRPHIVPCPGTRLPWDQPFASNSVWNIGIGTGAQWDTTSAAARQLRSLNGVINTTDWGIATYIGQASDPLVTFKTEDGTLPPQQIHVSSRARPTGGTDRDMTFYDTTQPGKVWSFFGVSFNGSTASGGMGSVYSTMGDGVTTLVPQQVTYNYTGVINKYDIDQGAIRHMLRVAISPNDLAMPPNSTWNTNIPWPNDHVDYNGPTAYTGIIPAGTTYGIPANVDLSKLRLSKGGMMLGKALQDYGAMWKDMGGTSQITATAVPELADNRLLQQMEADFSKLVPYLAILTNQGPHSVNGGGSYPHEVTANIATPGTSCGLSPRTSAGPSSPAARSGSED